MIESSEIVISQMKKKCDDVADLLRLVAHPQKLLILCHLCKSERNVGELERLCGRSQSVISQFLMQMRAEKIVTTRREHRKVYYQISDDRVLKLILALYEVFCS